MAITSTLTSVDHAGDGTSTVFAVSYVFFGADELEVIERNLATGAETTKTLTTHYTVTGGNGAAGSVTAVVAPPSGVRWYIRRKTARVQNTVYAPNDPFPAKSHERALDRLTAIAQEAASDGARALLFPKTDGAATRELPADLARAGKLLGFDASGNPIATTPGAIALGPGDVTTDKLAADVLALIAGGTATIVAGEALADRDLIYQDVFNQRGGGADRWYKIDTDAVSPVRISPRIGIALAAIASGASGSAQVRAGAVSGFSGLTPGLLCFASGTAGAVTQTAPAIPTNGAQNATREIGTALSATSIDFKPYERTVFTGRGTSVAVDGTIVLQHWTDAGAREREQAAYLVQAQTTAVVAGGTGTNIGDFTANGGLAAIFDGNTNQDFNASGSRTAAAQGAFGTAGYFGKTYSPGKRITQAVVWGSNNPGYVNVANPTVTLVLRGKNGAAPSSRTDGTSLGSVAFTDTANESGNPRTIASSDTTTTWDHVWIDLSHNGTQNDLHVAELQFTEITGAARDEPLTIGGSLANSTATDRVNVRYDDGAGANADTRTTFINRTNATRDLAVEVQL